MATRHTLPSNDRQVLPSRHFDAPVVRKTVSAHSLQVFSPQQIFPSESLREENLFGLRRAYLLCDRDRIVNVTPPNSSAVAAHGATPALPKNLSLADLLFADSPANAGSDFRAIAATLFGVGNSTQTQTPVRLPLPGRNLLQACLRRSLTRARAKKSLTRHLLAQPPSYWSQRRPSPFRWSKLL